MPLGKYLPILGVEYLYYVVEDIYSVYLVVELLRSSVYLAPKSP